MVITEYFTNEFGDFKIYIKGISNKKYNLQPLIL